jgi:hypothetical protein
MASIISSSSSSFFFFFFFLIKNKKILENLHCFGSFAVALEV